MNFYNPDMIVIGGGVSNLGNLLLSSIRQAVFSRSLPLATRNLQIVFSGIGSDAGISAPSTWPSTTCLCSEPEGATGPRRLEMESRSEIRREYLRLGFPVARPRP